MATAKTILSEHEYRAFALSDDDHVWELWNGALAAKPPTSVKHDNVSSYLGFGLADQLDRGVYRVNINGGRTRYTSRNFYVPDVIVIPAAYQRPFEHDPMSFNAYADPLPLVVEVWSVPIDGYDVAAKLALYRQRGDLEIWFIHPYERTLTVWRKQPDGSYAEEIYRGGIVAVASLPGVEIDLDALLAS